MRSMVSRIVVAFALVTGALLVGCAPDSPKEYGRQLYSDPTLSTAGSNVFSCVTCHEVVPNPTTLHPGYTLFDTAVRPSWWGGEVDTLFDAVNQCLTNFMRSNQLTPDDPKGRALLVYLQSVAPDATAPALPLTIVQNIVDIPSGDPVQGKAIWDSACGYCHGAPHTGVGRLATSVSLVPDDSIMAHGVDPKTGARPVVIEKTRHGKFFNVGGNMAFYSVEKLSDAQLGQVLGYLEQFGLPPYSGM